MPSFALPRVTVPARLRLTQGDTREGHIYLMERTPLHPSLETPLEMLNRPEEFFPFRHNGDILLVTKAHTVALLVDRAVAATDPDRLSAARHVALELALADGTMLAGWADAELPEYHARLLDYLNDRREPFFAVSTDAGTQYINRAHVLFARPRG